MNLNIHNSGIGASLTQPSLGYGPCVSVVMPTYNRAHLLPRAIGSVLAQTFSDFELLVVDDGSTDRTGEVVAGFKDGRIRVLRLDRNDGASRARNAGIQAARGAWVAFLDSDDEWLPRKLELQLTRLQEVNDPRATVAYCLCEQDDGATKRTVPSSGVLPGGDVFDHLLRNQRPPTASAFVVKRSALLNVGGFDENFPSSNDIDLWLRLAEARNHFLTVNEVLVIKHDHFGPQISNDPVAPVLGFRKFDRRWGPVMRQRVGLGVYRQWKARRRARIQYFQLGRIKAAVARGERISAFRYCLAMTRLLPGSFPSLIHGVLLATLGCIIFGRRTSPDQEAKVESRPAV